jgi:phage repressor protein C with HTH and peptisase S24 domain
MVDCVIERLHVYKGKNKYLRQHIIIRQTSTKFPQINKAKRTKQTKENKTQTNKQEPPTPTKKTKEKTKTKQSKTNNHNRNKKENNNILYESVLTVDYIPMIIDICIIFKNLSFLEGTTKI